MEKSPKPADINETRSRRLLPLGGESLSAYINREAAAARSRDGGIVSWNKDGKRFHALYVRPASTWSDESLDRLLADVRRS